PFGIHPGASAKAMAVSILACAPPSRARFLARTPLFVCFVGRGFSFSGPVFPGAAASAHVHNALLGFFFKRSYFLSAPALAPPRGRRQRPPTPCRAATQLRRSVAPFGANPANIDELPPPRGPAPQVHAPQGSRKLWLWRPALRGSTAPSGPAPLSARLQ